MSPKEISERREELDIEREDIKARHTLELEELKLEYKRIQIRCKHPNGYTYSIMGRDTGWKCPDCGLSR